MSDERSAGATTAEMRAVRGEVAAVQTALNDFRSEVQNALTRLTEAITNLARFEERLVSQSVDLARAIRWLESHEKRLNVVEVAQGRSDEKGQVNTDARRNIERLSFTLAGTVGGAGLLFLLQRVLG